MSSEKHRLVETLIYHGAIQVFRPSAVTFVTLIHEILLSSGDT